MKDLVIRVIHQDEAYGIVLRITAAHAVGVRVMLSHAVGVHEELLQVLIGFTQLWKKPATQIVETDGELLWNVREQGVSDDYHRYGNLGKRATEIRVEPI